MDFTTALAQEFAPEFTATPFAIVVVRMLLAVALGGVIGLEREANGPTAGLRTHILISLASCLFALISLELMTLTGQGAETKSDPLRLIEAVTAGVAFLVAGSIISSGGNVQGLTTGAGMWLAGAVGLSCGAGQLSLAVLAAGISVVVLWLIRPLSRRIGGDQT